MKNSAALFLRIKDKANTRIEINHLFQRTTKQALSQKQDQMGNIFCFSSAMHR